MIFFGHVGLTLGAAWGLHNALEAKKRRPGESPGNNPTRPDASPARKVLALMRRLDYRIVLVGAVLPDIIDKPLGVFLVGNGHIYAHTLLFFILLVAGGFYLYRARRRTWLFAVSAGVLTHIVFDRIWNSLPTLFWPLFGFAFPPGDVSGLVPPVLRPGSARAPALSVFDINNWMPETVRSSLTNPGDYIPELLGMAVLLFFACVLIRKRQVRRFLGSGRVPVVSED